MNATTYVRAAARQLVCLDRVSRRPSREAVHLRQWLRSISGTTAPSRSSQLPNKLAVARPWLTTEPPRRCFTAGAQLYKKSQKAAPTKADKSESAAVDDPRDFTVLEKEISVAHERLRESLSKLRSGGRFNHELLERLRVQPDKSSASKVPLSDVAQVIPKGRTIHIIVGEKEHLKPITSAIASSDLSLTPQPDPTGTNPLLLEIKVPPPTAESRQNAVKEAVKAGEKASVAIRDARAKQHKKHRAMQSIRTITSDTLHKAGNEMEKVVEKAQSEVKKTVDGAKKMLESV